MVAHLLIRLQFPLVPRLAIKVLAALFFCSAIVHLTIPSCPRLIVFSYFLLLGLSIHFACHGSALCGITNVSLDVKDASGFSLL